MEQETKVTLRNYAICIGVEILIAFLVIWSKGFFTQSTAVNIQILSDAFFVAGALMTLFAGLMYVSGEGVLLGARYLLRNALRLFIPMGREKFEKYTDYRDRKLAEAKERNRSYILITGLIFLFIGVAFSVIWYTSFYSV